MADLIDRAELLKAIRAEAVNAMELNANRYCESALAFAHCHSMVKKAPAVDAVPVVRCKDCIHMGKSAQFRHCRVWGAINGMGDEGFCNYGERKET
jgi:hypothetical protein